MLNLHDIRISFTPILTQDPKGRGYTGYLAEFPDLFAQGKDKEEVERNLLISLTDILEHRKQQTLFKNHEAKQKEAPAINLAYAPAL
jgi:predicted RNase H-like HicB family nuclease